MKRIEYTESGNKIISVQFMDLIALRSNLQISVPLMVYLKTEKILCELTKNEELIYDYVSFDDKESLQFLQSEAMEWICEENEFEKKSDLEKEQYKWSIFSKCNRVRNKYIHECIEKMDIYKKEIPEEPIQIGEEIEQKPKADIVPINRVYFLQKTLLRSYK